MKAILLPFSEVLFLVLVSICIFKFPCVAAKKPHLLCTHDCVSGCVPLGQHAQAVVAVCTVRQEGVRMRKAGNFIDRQVGARVRSIRDAARVSMYDTAVLIGVSVDRYQRLEAGHERFEAPHLRALAEKFGVCVTEFFGRIEASEMESAGKSNVVPLSSVLH